MRQAAWIAAAFLAGLVALAMVPAPARAGEVEPARPEADPPPPGGLPCPAPTPLSKRGPCDPALVAGYDRQFYVRSRSGCFKATVWFYTQARWTWNRREMPPPDERADTTDWEMARTRIFAEADVTKYFYTHLRVNVDAAGEVALIVSYLQVNPVEGFHVRIGRQFVALSREDWMYPQDLLSMDFSANDSVFAIGTPHAIQARKTWSHDRAWLTVSDGAFGDGVVSDSTQRAKVAVTGRYEHQFSTSDWSVWDDLVGRRGRPRGLLLGAAGGYQWGETDTPSRWSALVTADLSYNWNGGQALVYGSYVRADSRTDGVVDTYGFLAQAGQFVTCGVQVYGRYEFVSAGDRPGDLENYRSVLAGVNWFPFQWTNRYKLTAEAGYLFSALSRTLVPAGTNVGFLPADEGDQFFLRFQVQFGF